MSEIFDSTQSVEITIGECSSEVDFVIDLVCTAPSRPGSFNPIDGGHPPEGPEFEPDMIRVVRPEVKRDPIMSLTWEQFMGLLGVEMADELLDRACIEAADSGLF